MIDIILQLVAFRLQYLTISAPFAHWVAISACILGGRRRQQILIHLFTEVKAQVEFILWKIGPWLLSD